MKNYFKMVHIYLLLTLISTTFAMPKGFEEMLKQVPTSLLVIHKLQRFV